MLWEQYKSPKNTMDKKILKERTTMKKIQFLDQLDQALIIKDKNKKANQRSK